MRNFGETKHRKVLHKSKKQWITVGVTSAALGITGLVHNTELAHAEEVVTAEAEEDVAEVTDSEDNTPDLATLIATYTEKINAGELDQETAIAELTAAVSELEGVVVEDIVSELQANVAATEETTEEAPVEEAPVEEEIAPEANEAPVATATRAAAPAAVSLAAAPAEVTDANLDASLGSPVHADGTLMEERQVDIELDQQAVRDALMQKIRDFRTLAYNENLPFQFNSYDGATATQNTIQAAARAVGLNTAEAYANNIDWSDRLEDYAIQRATEMLTTGYHSGNNSHRRPDMQKELMHDYYSADGTVSHSAPENIHTNGNDDFNRAFEAWSTREISNLRSANGAFVYGGQSITTTHIHAILNPVHTKVAGASVVLANGQSGVSANRSNIMIVMPNRWDTAANGHVSGSEARQGTYRVTVQTKAGGPALPGEVSETPADVVLAVDFTTDYEFNADLGVDESVVVREGVEGVSVNGVITEYPVNELVQVGPSRNAIAQPADVEIFDANLAVDEVVREEGNAGFELVNPLNNEVIETTPATATVISYGPTQEVTEFETITEVNFDLDLGQTVVVTEGQNGVTLYNPLNNEVVSVESEVINEVVQVGVEQREVPFETERRAIVGLDAERVVREGVNGVAYFDADGNQYDERSVAPVNAIVEYPAIARTVEFDTERVAVVGLEAERVAQEGANGVQYFDEDGNELDVSENTPATTEIIEYPATSAVVEFDTERVAVVGLEAERVAQEGVNGLVYLDEAGNAIDASENVEAVTQIVEYPAIAQVVEFETERVAVIGLEDENVAQVGEDGLAYYDEDGNLLDVAENVEPVTEIVEYPAIPQVLPFETERVASPDLAEGQERIESVGEDGVAYYDEDGNVLEVIPAVNRVVLFGEAAEAPTTPVTPEVPATPETPAKPVVSRPDAKAAVKAQVEGLANLTSEEKAQIIAALDSLADTDRIEELLKAAVGLNEARGGQSSEASEKATRGETLPDTATAAWAFGLAGMTSLLSGLGIKKFKK